jgi:RNA polymerase sigma-70 factor (ECF subfamily)
MGRRLRDDPEVEDLCQETLLDAFRDLHGFRYTSPGDFRNWLARIAENNVRDHFRRGRTQKRGEGFVRMNCELESSSLTESIFPGKEPRPSENARKDELEERIEHALAHEIGERYREAILLRDLCRMSYEEIAAKMGYSGASTARALYTRAKQKLKECL